MTMFELWSSHKDDQTDWADWNEYREWCAENGVMPTEEPTAFSKEGILGACVSVTASAADLSVMKVAELKTLCKERGLDVTGLKTKAEFISALTAEGYAWTEV